MRISRGYARLARYREIAEVAARYGFGFLVDLLGRGGGIPAVKWPPGRARREVYRLPRWERVRRALEDLGPVFVKAGQIAGTRPDVVPQALASELQKLQDEARPFAFSEVEAQITAELRGKPDEVFALFEREPAAAASLGQVHNAVLKSGEEVVVKVQRPDVDKITRTDLEILREMATVAGPRLALGRVYDLVDIVDELALALSKELDYAIEGANTDRFAENLRGDPHVVVPRVFWEYTTRRVLTMERIHGVKLTEMDLPGAAPQDKHAIAWTLANTALEQILVHGLFHADLHPGNVIVTPEGNVALLDFGMVGEVSDDLKAEFGSFLMAVAARSPSRLVDVMDKLGVASPTVDRRALTRDVDVLQRRYYGIPLSQLSVAGLMNDIFNLALKHRIRIGSDFVIVMRALATLEGTVRGLVPSFNLVEVAEPFARRIIRERLTPGSILRNVERAAVEFRETVSMLPRRFGRVLDLAAEGRLRVKWEFDADDRFFRRVDLLLNRLVLSIVLASIIVGTALAARVERPVLPWHLTLGEAGFMVAVGIGVWLLLLIIRSGRF